jgi:hypothetical protein
MKAVLFIIKLIPVITIVHGFVSSGVRVGSLFDTAKVAMTQYELAQISIVISKPEHIKTEPIKFADFVNEQYYSQYSVLARQFIGNNENDLATDLWSKPYKLIPIQGTDDFKISSSGPDRLQDTKDDLEVVINVPQSFSLASAPAPKKAPVVKQVNEEQTIESNDRAPASEEDTYDQEGYDRDGFDHDGYDHQGFDHDGYNQDGVDANGNQKPE